MSRLSIILISSLLLTGCISALITQPTAVKNTINDDRQTVKQHRTQAIKTPLVIEYDHVYVEPLSKAAVQMPPWYQAKVDKSFSSQTIDKILFSTFIGMNVHFEFRDGIKLNQFISVNSQGTYGDILDSVAAQTGYNYQVSRDGHTIVWSKYLTESFHIEQLGGTVKYSIGRKGIQSGRSGDSNLSTGQQDTAGGNAISDTEQEYSVMSGTINVLADVQLGVNAILGCKSTATSPKAGDSDKTITCEHEATSAIIAADNSIMVRALPSQIANVRQFITQMNQSLSQQVAIDITLINVEFSDSTQGGIDFNLIDKTFKNWGSIGLTTTANAGGIGGLDPRGIFTLGYARQGEDPSRLFIEALSSQGAVSEKRYPRVVTMNNKLGTIGNIDSELYISDRPISTTANVGSTLGITQGTATTGYTLHALPNIGPDAIIVHLSTSLSALLDLVKKGVPGAEVESPKTNDKLFNTTVRLQDGKPMIIAGLSDDRNQYKQSQSGVLLPGMAKTTKSRNVETILMIKATIF
jgi:MSHA biogenesis protein MshL